MNLHPQYINDSSGNRMVILSEKEYNKIIEELEEAEDIKLFTKTMTDDDGVRIPLEDAFKQIDANRKVS
jgi:hypothetical protein